MTLLTRTALRRPLTVYVLMAIIVLAGISVYRAMPRESFPEIKVPLIIVSVVYPGASPVDMESQVTRKVETEVKGVSGVKEIRSTSADGYCSIQVEFNPDVVLDTALQKVREAVDRARPEMPADVEEPVVSDVDFSRIPIMIVSVAGDFGMARLKSIADDVKDELEAISGVNLVNAIGGQDREVQVFADQRRLTAFSLGLEDLVETIGREHLSTPGGDIDVGRQNFLVRLTSEVDDPSEILDFVVKADDDRPIYIRDVATVVYGFEEAETRSRVNGRTSISLTIEKRTGANIIEVADNINAALDRLRLSMPPGVELAVLADMSVDIRDMVKELENNILSGLVLVLVILFFALGWRPAVIVSAAIPFSMLISFIVLSLLGYTLNMVVLFSLVLVLGMLVDNAIVTVENIYRHRAMGDDSLKAAGTGASEVAMPIIASTATTLCAFGPMLLWPGIVGEFMKYLPVTLIIGLIASLFVALVINPALALVLFRNIRGSVRKVNLDSWFMRSYRWLLEWCLDQGPAAGFHFWRNWFLLVVFFAGIGTSLAIAMFGMLTGAPIPQQFLMWLVGIAAFAFGFQGVLWVLSLLAAVFRRRVWITDHRARVLWTMGAMLALTFAAYGAWGSGSEFFPEIDPREIWVDFKFPSGTNLDAQDAVVGPIEERLADTADLTDLLANIGSTGVNIDPGSGGGASNESRISVQIERFGGRSQSSVLTMDQVREQAQGLTGVEVVIDKPEDGVPAGKPVSVQLSSENYSDLQATAEALKRRMREIPGLYNVDDDFDEGYPELRIEVDRTAAARANTNTGAIASTLRTALAGTEVAKYRIGEDEYDIVVRLPREARRSIDSIEELTVQDEDGNPRPLLSLAHISTTAGPAAIQRVDLRRTITVEADVDHSRGFRDADMRAAVAAVLDGEMDLAPGMRYEFAGSNEEEQESSEFLSRAFVIALLLIGLILVTEFDSLVTPITILISVVLSLIGVLWGLILTSTPFGIVMTGIGVISLAGIVVNNAIVLCDFIIQERRNGLSRRDAIIEAGMVRIRPVLLTAITTILGLIPLTTGVNFDFFEMSVTTGGESTQWWGAMGVAVICGLAVATVLTLLVVPVTYDVLDSMSDRVSRRK